MKVKYLKYIPLQALIELGLNSNQIILAAIVMSFYKDDKKLRVGYDKLSEASGIPARTVRRDMAILANTKLVTNNSGYKERNANEYIPTKKLIALYGHRGHIDIAKMATHTPSKEGYNRETDADALARRHGFTKEYAADQKLFGIENAKARLDQRIALKGH